MPGYDRSRIVGMTEEELGEFTCSICQDIFKDPMVTQCCRQTYCKVCIEEWLTSHNTCPNDRKELRSTELLPPPRLVVNFVNNMKTKCDYQENGCNIVIKIGDLFNHIKVCEHRPGRFCEVCGLEKDAQVHDCIGNLVIKNKSIFDEMTRLGNEIAKLKQDNKALVVSNKKLCDKLSKANNELEQLDKSICDEKTILCNEIAQLKHKNNKLVATHMWTSDALRKENDELKQLNRIIIDEKIVLGNEIAQLKQKNSEDIDDLVLNENLLSNYVIVNEAKISSGERDELVKSCQQGILSNGGDSVASRISNEIEKKGRFGDKYWNVIVGKRNMYSSFTYDDKFIHIVFNQSISIVIYTAKGIFSW